MLRKIIGIVAILSLGACASPYIATPYDRTSANVSTIAVVDDGLEPKAMAYEVASTGANFGLIGALVDAGIQESRKNAVNNALEEVQFNAEDIMEARLATAIRSQGYSVSQLSGPRAKRDFLVTYPATEGGEDAYLDMVVMNYGYMSSGAGQPFRPTVYAKVRLMRASDDTMLMENMILYNPIAPSEGVITLSPNPDYAFRHREGLLEDPARLAAGLEDALNQVADTAAQLLR
jgi:hypothetical protein